MRHRGEAAGVAWTPMLCSGYLVVSPFDLLRVRVPPRAWVRVRVRMPLLRVPTRVLRMRLPVRVPSVRWLLQPCSWAAAALASSASSVLWLVHPRLLIFLDYMCNVDEVESGLDNLADE